MSYHNKPLGEWTEEDKKEYEADYEAYLFRKLEEGEQMLALEIMLSINQISNEALDRAEAILKSIGGEG